MWIKKQQLEPDMKKLTGSKLGEEYIKNVYCHPAYLTSMQSKYIMWNAGLDSLQIGIKIAGRNINNLRYSDNITLMAEGEEELKSFLMSVKEESEKHAWNSTFKTLGSWLPVPIVHSKKSGSSDRFSYLVLWNHCEKWLQPWN